MYYFGYLSFNNKKSSKIAFVIGGVLTFFLIAFAANFRNHQIVTLGSLFVVIGDVVYELGFSFFPLSAISGLQPYPPQKTAVKLKRATNSCCTDLLLRIRMYIQHIRQHP